MNQKKALASIHNISFETEPKKYLLRDISTTILEGEKIGLVGPNGVGKSTFLKIIKGDLAPARGTVKRISQIAYLPQINEIDTNNDLLIYEYVSSKMEEWWEALKSLEENFNFSIKEDQKVSSLSGGELIKLNLAICFAQSSQLMLLDEPTNHLDIKSLRQLESALRNYKGAYVIVSHNAFFLDKVTNRIWDLEDKNIQEYGVNYEEYKLEKHRQLNAMKRKYFVAQKDMGKLEESRKRERIRVSNSIQKGLQSNKKRTTTRKGKAFLKNRHEIKVGKKKDMFLDREEKIKDRLEKYKTPEKINIFLDLKESEAKQNKLLIEINEGKLYIQDPRIDILNKLSFDIRYGQKKVLSGENGSGKTTFLKAMTKSKNNNIRLKTEKFYQKEDLSFAYIDQNYRTVDKSKSLIENMLAKNPDNNEEKAKRILASLRLKSDPEFKKKAHELSGGELARLTFATEILRDIDLLILDEPTNNLDLETKDIIIETLKNFKGALLIVSHDIDFLNRIGINEALIIKDKKLKKMKHSPLEKDEFYKELVNLA